MNVDHVAYGPCSDNHIQLLLTNKSDCAIMYMYKQIEYHPHGYNLDVISKLSWTWGLKWDLGNGSSSPLISCKRALMWAHLRIRAGSGYTDVGLSESD